MTETDLTSDMNQCLYLSVKADLGNLNKIRGFVERTSLGLGVKEDAVDDMVLAVDEAVSNIILHGYRNEVGMVEIEIAAVGRDLVIRLRDRAYLFNPTHLPEPDISLPLDARTPGGLGVFLIRQSVDDFYYRVLPQGGNELTLVKENVIGAS